MLRPYTFVVHTRGTGVSQLDVARVFVYPTPEMYHGPTLYGEEVFGQLPNGLSVLQLAPCTRSPCSTVDRFPLEIGFKGARAQWIFVSSPKRRSKECS